MRKVDPGFDEVIVVDQGDAGRTRRIVERVGGLNATVLRHPVKSAAQARNAGIERAAGDVVFFIDDDTELPPDYVAAALRGFAEHPRAVGLSGPTLLPAVRAERRRLPVRLLRRFARLLIWLLLRLLRNAPLFRPRVLRSGGAGPPPPWLRRRPHLRQNLPGGHSVYRRLVFDEGLRFDPGYTHYSAGEDRLFSYQAYKRFGRGSLRSVPDFTLVHHRSGEARMPIEVAIRMRIVYRFIFWRREVYGGSPLNLLCYLYGQLGLCLPILMRPIYRRGRWRAIGSAYRYLIRNWRSVAADRIDYNRFILQGRER